MDSRRRPVLAVLGGGRADERCLAAAREVGRVAAEHGWVVLTGGGPGVMSAAAEGACRAGGLTVGVLPGSAPGAGYPNPWIQVAVVTGLGHARNAVNVLSASLCVAVGGGPGTLSEVALALKSGVETWCLWSWGLTPPEAGGPLPRVFTSTEALLTALPDRLGVGHPR